MKEKLLRFAALVEADQRRRMELEGYTVPIECGDHKTSIKLGSKWARVDIGTSGRYMVDMTTGEIGGTKAYGVPHMGHRYGTLDTIEDWDWSGYWATRKKVSESV